MNVTIFGIPNCDSCKKALKWLKNHNIEHNFINVREYDLTASKIRSWLQHVPVEKLVNKRSTTWKQLDAEQQQQAIQAPDVVLVQNPTLIKRPVLEMDDYAAVGFKPADYAELFSIEEQ